MKNNYTGYNIWGVALTEVEVDILTGEMYVVRVDIINDAGLSTSPLVDVGQVEGAFVMGQGLWTSEQIKHHPTTGLTSVKQSKYISGQFESFEYCFDIALYKTVSGELLTFNSWEYKPPAARDIPQDFRVTLLKNVRNPTGMLSSKSKTNEM